MSRVLAAHLSHHAVDDRAGEAIAALGGELPKVPDTIPEIHFAEATAMVGAALGVDLADACDLAPAHERWLGEWALREHGSDLLFVTGYPP